LQTILPVFVIIILGAFYYRIKLAKYSWVEVLNEFVVRIGFPSLIFSTLVKLQWDIQLHGQILIANSIFVLCSFSLALLLGNFFSLNKKLKRTLFLAATYGNIAYLGIPVIELFLGKAFLPEASLITACYLFWIFTVGMIYLEYSKTGEVQVKLVFLKLIKNPIIISVIAGVIVLSIGVNLPPVVVKPLEMISAAVTPVILFSLGIFLGSSSIGKLKVWIPVSILVIYVLVLKPFIFLMGVKGLALPVQSFHTSILDAGMPLALTPFALSGEFDLDADFLARGIVLSTVLSVITLSLWHNLLLGF
jgi:predicted permease